MNPSLEVLLTIQRRDELIRTFQEKIKRLNLQREKIEETLSGEKDDEDKAKEKYNELRLLTQARADEVDDLDTQIRNYEKQLKEGLLSFKEMEHFQEQIKHNKERMEAGEEEAIALLDQVEVEEEKWKKREASYNQWKSRIDDEIKEIDEELTSIKQQLAAEQTERNKLVENADQAHLAKYNQLLEALGDPLAVMREGRCTGCGLELSRSTVERTRAGTEFVSCENCTRILYAN
jgi:hypothetical protein